MIMHKKQLKSHAGKIKLQILQALLVINTNLKLNEARYCLKQVINLSVYTSLWLLGPKGLHDIISYCLIIIVSCIRNFL